MRTAITALVLLLWTSTGEGWPFGGGWSIERKKNPVTDAQRIIISTTGKSLDETKNKGVFLISSDGKQGNIMIFFWEPNIDPLRNDLESKANVMIRFDSSKTLRLPNWPIHYTELGGIYGLVSPIEHVSSIMSGLMNSNRKQMLIRVQSPLLERAWTFNFKIKGSTKYIAKMAREVDMQWVSGRGSTSE